MPLTATRERGGAAACGFSEKFFGWFVVEGCHVERGLRPNDGAVNAGAEAIAESSLLRMVQHVESMDSFWLKGERGLTTEDTERTDFKDKGKRFSVFSFRFSVFSFRFSVFGFRFSVFGFQFSVFSWRFSVGVGQRGEVVGGLSG